MLLEIHVTSLRNAYCRFGAPIWSMFQKTPPAYQESAVSKGNSENARDRSVCPILENRKVEKFAFLASKKIFCCEKNFFTL